MKSSFFPSVMISLMLLWPASPARAADVVTSSDLANAWNSGSSSISILGELVPGTPTYAIELTNYLNPFSGATTILSGVNGLPGTDPGSNVLFLGPYSLAFAPGWNNGLDATIENLGLYGATNGAVSFMGNGIGAHSLAVDNTYFYANTGATGGGVNVQTQIQSAAGNTYVLTDNMFLFNSAATGGAVAMAANNSIEASGANTFSVIDTGGSMIVTSRLFGLNKATAGNGGGLYFMGNNALGVNNNFITKGYAYYLNSATDLGGAVFIGALNGNQPSVNNFSVTGSQFLENQARSGGAVATSINGGGRNVNVELEGLFWYNIASDNGGAIYNGVGDQYSPFAGNIKFTINGVFDSNLAANGGAIYNDLRPGQSNVIVDIINPGTALLPTIFNNNTVSGNGGAIYNTSSNVNGGSAVLNIEDGIWFSGNSANYGGAIYNDGNGVINLNTKHGGMGIIFTDNSAAGYANGSDIYQASASATINITGNGVDGTILEGVTVNGGIAGIGTINQQMQSLFILGEKSQSFDFKGTFNQAGFSEMDVYGLMFGGTNNLAGRTEIHSGLDTVYFNANMESYSYMNYWSSATARVSIGAATGDSAPGFQFKGTGATVNFAGDADLNQPRALFTLNSKIDNGNANTITFKGSDVTFGSTDFMGGTDYQFTNNSVINLAGPLDPYQEYRFGKLTTDGGPFVAGTNSLLSFRAGSGQTPGSLLTDTIYVQNADTTGILGLGRVYINDANGVLNGKSRVINADLSDLLFENNQSQYVATSTGSYQVTTVDDQYVEFTNTTPSGPTTTTIDQDGGTTTTTDHTGTPGGGSTTTTTDTDGGATTVTDDGAGNTTTTTATPDGGSGVTHTSDDGQTSSSKTNADGSTETTITYADGGTAVTTTKTDGSGSLTHTDSGGNTTTVTIDTNGNSTITDNDGNTIDSIAHGGSGGGTTGDGGIITINPDGSGGTTVTFTGDGGSGSSSVTTTPGGTNGSSSSTIDSGGNTIGTTVDSGGNSTTTGTTTGGAGATVSNPVGDGGITTTDVTTPDGGSGASTTVTTDQGGGGSTVTNPDTSKAGTTIGDDGAAKGTATPSTTSGPPVLNDVNALTATATGVGMSSTNPRGYQIGQNEIYYNGADLDQMANGEFSVYGAAAGSRTSILSGLDEPGGTNHQSLFDIVNNGTIFTLADLTVQDAYSATGGSVLAMNNADSTATFDNLTIRSNESGGDGGAVNIQDGTFTSTDVDYQGNKAAGQGGAIANDGGGITTVRGGSFSENEAVDGGAIYNNSSYSKGMTINSGSALTFTGNTATGAGGAIYNGNGATLTLIADSFETENPDDGSIVFSGNTANGTPNDIHNDGGNLIFTGAGAKIILGGGVSGTGTITKEGQSSLVLGEDADNSGFTGNFSQTKGDVDANGKFFGGTSEITGGILNWNPGATKDDTAIFQVTGGGVINIYGDLKLGNPDDFIAPEAWSNLFGNVEIAGGAMYLSPQDQLRTPGGGGTVEQSDGYLVVGGAGLVILSGMITQTGGVVHVEREANVVLDGSIPGSGLLAGDIAISNATMSTNGFAFTNYGAGGGSIVPTSGSLARGDDALMNAADGVVHEHSFTGKFGLFSEMGPTAIANFSVDLNPQAFQSDMFVFGGGTATSGVIVNGHPNQADLPDLNAMPGTVVLSGLNLINSPGTEIVPFTIMSSPSGIDAGLTFTAFTGQVDTPIGAYGLYSLGAGKYELRLLGLNPQVSRGQVAAQAAAGAQSYVNSLLFDHVYLDSFDRAAAGRSGEPRQFADAGKGLWAKPYFVSESLPFGGNIGDVDHDAYGLVMGMDFPALALGDGWNFLPTVFAAFNRGNQKYQGVDMTQTGGQVGLMGTFAHGRFMASVMGYAGRYHNEMDVAGYEDRTNNWFAGAAAKAAYNLAAGENLVFQPYALLAYNASGDQEWTSDYGDIRMETGSLNGWNVAPGLAVIYDQPGWSLQASAHYMFNINNEVEGQVGRIDLPSVGTGDGYLEYGLGASRKINDSLSFEGKVTLRSGSGLENYGGHLGFSWEF